MVQELFGLVVTVYIYKDNDWEKALGFVNATSEYALMGTIFSKNRYALVQGIKVLENAADNFYIDDGEGIPCGHSHTIEPRFRTK